MGCACSSDSGDASAPKAPKVKKETPKDTKCEQKTEEKDPEPWSSKERTIAYIMKELNIKEDIATKLYDKVNKNGDGEMDAEEVKALLAIIEEANTEIKPLFAAADANNTGTVSVKEGTKIMKELYPNMSEKPMRKLLKKFDDGDGCIRYGEFIIFYYYLKQSEKKFRPEFEKCDANHTGTVTLTEAAVVLQATFPKMDEMAIKKMLYRFDSGDAIVQYEEFIMFHANLLSARESLTRKFDALDKDDDGSIPRNKVIDLVAEETGMEEEDCKRFVFHEDVNNDGRISKSEFLDLWSAILND